MSTAWGMLLCVSCGPKRMVLNPFWAVKTSNGVSRPKRLKYLGRVYYIFFTQTVNIFCAPPPPPPPPFRGPQPQTQTQTQHYTTPSQRTQKRPCAGAVKYSSTHCLLRAPVWQLQEFHHSDRAGETEMLIILS